MKIICIGKNYLKHIHELNSQIPEKPVFFCKPDTALLIKNRPFYIPDFSNEIHYETEVIVKINRVGKEIAPKFAGTYYDEISLGFDFTARDLQREYSQKGLPWEIAKGFDNSAAIGDFISKTKLPPVDNLRFKMLKNGICVQDANTSDMLFKIDELISYVSRFMTLKIGDILFTGTPCGVGKVEIGDRLEAYLEGEKLLACEIR